MSPAWRAVARSDEVRPGRPRVVQAGGAPVALVRAPDGGLHAVVNVCPHRGGPVGEGELQDGILTCPWHNWSFRLDTGQHVANPGVALRKLEVREEGGDVLLPE